jgi:NhaA family Na+:H+ antiporter
MKNRLVRLYHPWEKFFRKTVYSAFEAFLHAQMTNGIILMLFTLTALIWVNSPWSASYEHLLHTQIAFSVGSFSLDHSVHFWVNDGLMTLFFFHVGLEIKREILVGELSDFKVAVLPILAAIGGMVVPALIFFAITKGTPGASGWGIPMATDIAFAVSVVILLGKRISPALVTFLVALAIVDDLGAVSVIAIFYTAKIQILSLLIALALWCVLILLNRFGIRSALPYTIIGVFVWFFTLESGVHATIAGVLVAMTIPSLPKYDPRFFAKPMKELINGFEEDPIKDNFTLDDKQKRIVRGMKSQLDGVEAPLNRYEDGLHVPIGILIIPIFALINAGLPIDFSSLDALLLEKVSLGVIFGLVLGKMFGIFGASYIAIKLGLAKLPEDTSMNQLFGVSFLGGIGFTMSIFVADLAYSDDIQLLIESKTAVLFASLIAGLVGYIWLRFIASSKSA